ncbi:MAG TPA: 6,7-dimethyl-8-ribityllumazine synthase [Verrucomicrobiae bacterium]|jgi:6,7-dimethyl-8-ribityllumazine synthase|nr:6,7-dimethyl-8-ribityllumazine synthase [Verrucomicrobiae bacterium]
MLKSNRSKNFKARGGQFVIIASKYNARYVDAMLKSAQSELKRAGAAKVKIVRVPGAFEIPTIATKLANASHKTSDSRIAAFICLGVILRGQTVHAEHIGRAVTEALMWIQVRYEVPVIHEVLLLENEEQARVRCLGTKYNRGTEAAQTALEMARVMAEL